MATKTIPASHVRPKETFSGTYEGAPFTFNPDHILDAKDPIVRKYPTMFVPLDTSRSRPTAEQMTKAPGEIRF